MAIPHLSTVHVAKPVLLGQVGGGGTLTSTGPTVAAAPVPVNRPEAPEDSTIPVVTAVAVPVAAEEILGPVRMGDTSRRPCMGPSPSTGVDMDPAAAAATAAAAVEEGGGATTGGRWRVTDTGGCQRKVNPGRP